jgi:hypothetical protein
VALGHDVTVDEVPITPMRVWKLLNG